MIFIEVDLTEKSQAHVIVRFLGFRFLFLLFLLFGGGCSSSGWSGSSRSSGSNSRSDVGNQVLDIATFQGLGKQTWPVWFNIDIGCLQDGLDLFTLFLDETKIKSSGISLHVVSIHTHTHACMTVIWPIVWPCGGATKRKTHTYSYSDIIVNQDECCINTG